jgi:type IX secretion system PorP/SprF family membrane protein
MVTFFSHISAAKKVLAAGFCILLCILSGGLLRAQDIHLSQFYTANLLLNPAYTGNYNGDIRATLNARTQWAELSRSIKTNIISIEKKIHANPTDDIGIGLIVANDQLNAYFLHTNKIHLSGSYHKKIGLNTFLLGAQVGGVFRSINIGGQTLPDQWNHGAGIYDPTLPNGEDALQNNWNYLDVNGGLGWQRKFNDTKISAGYAIFHINRPREKTNAGNPAVPFRHVFNVSAHQPLSHRTWLTPHLLYMNTVRAMDVLLITNLHYRINPNLSIMGGAGYRGSTANSDAIVGLVGGTYKRFTLGLSRDFTVSSLRKSASTKTAWEISLYYTSASRKQNKLTIPCERY